MTYAPDVAGANQRIGFRTRVKGDPPLRRTGMRVLVVHNCDRSSPSEEDRVVDQEPCRPEASARSSGSERLSDKISGLPTPQELSSPTKIVGNLGPGRALAETVHSSGPDVVHVHQGQPSDGAVDPAALPRSCPGLRNAPQLPVHLAERPDLRNGSHCSGCIDKNRFFPLVHGCYESSSLATVPISVATIFQRQLRDHRAADKCRIVIRRISADSWDSVSSLPR
jgi:hypothetical protein